MFRRMKSFILTVLHNTRMRGKMALLFLLFGFLPMLALSIAQLNAVIDNLEQQTEQALSLSLNQAARRIEAQIQAYNRVANSVVFDARIGPRLRARYNNLGEAIYLYHDIWNLFSSITRTDPSIAGLTVYTDNPGLITAPPYLVRVNALTEMQEYEHMHKAVVEPYLSDARIIARRQDYWYGKSHTGERVIGLNRAVSSVNLQGKSVGFVTLMIEETALLPLLDVDNMNATVFLIAPDQSILSSTDRTQTGASVSDLFPEEVWRHFDTQETFHLNDKADHRLMIRKLENKLVLCAMIPMNEVRAPTRRIQAWGIRVLCISALCAVVLVIFFVDRMTKRIRLLLNKMYTLSIDPLDPGVPIDGKDEIGELDHGFREMVLRLKDTARELYIIELEKKEAQLIALQSRINPHFLYNALSSIGWMIDTHTPDEVREAIDALARFYRSALSGGRDVITLREELRGLTAYLSIQSMRASDRMRAHIDIDELLMEQKVPKMTLQPIVENCIEHGIDEEHPHINILITSGVDESAALIYVEDDGAGISEDAVARIHEGSMSPTSGGYGIQNVQMRLKLYFGGNYGLTLEARPKGGTRVTIRIPLTEDDEILKP